MYTYSYTYIDHILLNNGVHDNEEKGLEEDCESIEPPSTKLGRNFFWNTQNPAQDDAIKSNTAAYCPS